MANYTNQIPEEYRPISMWGYFGYEILFSIPLIGWACVILFALTADNVNLRNFARSQFCYLILSIIFWVAGFFALSGLGVLESISGSIR